MRRFNVQTDAFTTRLFV